MIFPKLNSTFVKVSLYYRNKSVLFNVTPSPFALFPPFPVAMLHF